LLNQHKSANDAFDTSMTALGLSLTMNR